MELLEQVQQLLGPSGMEVEGAVEHADILDAMLVDGLQSFANDFDGQGTDRLFAATHTKGASIETSSGCFQLYEGLTPWEKSAFLGRGELVESEHSCQSVVMILALVVQPTQSGDIAPCFGLVEAGKPLGKLFFAFAPEDTIHKRVATEKCLVVAQKLRASQDEAGIGKQGLGT